MRFFIFDVETTGLPTSGKKNLTYRDVCDWPHIVQISWFIMNDDLQAQPNEIQDVIIQPQGFVIPPESSKIHRITQEIALQKGKVFGDIVDNVLEEVLEGCTHVVAHNLSFDSSVFLCELYRLKKILLIDKFLNKIHICTKDVSTPYCELRPFRYGSWKWPTLFELYFILRKKVMDSEKTHNSMYDTEILVECFIALIEKGLINGINIKYTRSGGKYIIFEN